VSTKSATVEAGGEASSSGPAIRCSTKADELYGAATAGRFYATACSTIEQFKCGYPSQHDSRTNEITIGSASK